MLRQGLIWLGCLALALWWTAADVLQAQVITAKVDYHTKSIAWDWTKGAPPNDGMAARFLVKCGPGSGQYTYPVKTVDMPTKTIPIASAVPSQGISYCRVFAANDYGESPGSNELSFDAGAVPAAASNVRVP